MFVTRLLSGIVLMIIATVGFVCGAPVLTAILLFTSMVGYRELIQALGVNQENGDKKFSAPEIVGYVAIVAYYTILFLFDFGIWEGDRIYCLFAVIVFFFLLEMFTYVFAFPKYHAEQIVSSVFAFLYAPVMLAFIELTRMSEGGKLMVWLILICSWGCDTCAYCVGVLIGKKKIFPLLSPKKSLEGCIGGVAGTMILGALFGHFAMKLDVTQTVILTIICGCSALVSMVGDLAASAIKRNKEIKDYGKLIPGHGGIMDRFDSVIVTGPMVYLLASFLMNH